MLRFWIPAVAGMTMPLAACHRGAPNMPTHHDATITCAIGAAGKLEAACPIDREVTAQGLMITVHHPDGGFRRLLVTTDGRGVVAADGASLASVIPLDAHEVEVVIENDRYHLPATVKP